MIRPSLTTACAALLGWHLSLSALPRRHHVIPTVERVNHQRAQQFVHARGPVDEVIAGSSMANRLDEIELGPHFSKLTFVGGSPLTALEIVRRSGRVPPVLWLETNMICRPSDPVLVDDATVAWRTALREDSGLFREDGRPSAFAIGLLKGGFGRAAREVPWLAGSPESVGARDPVLQAGIMQGNRLLLSRPPDPAELRRHLDELSLGLEELTRRGTKVVLFEMPIDPTLASLTLPVIVRTALRDRFPPGRWTWLDPGPPTDWRTTDGMHLDAADATRFARLIRDFVNSSGN
jgi:hypothetical protein